ncbi:uncharacterized protein BP01DRAFT_121402 [Aspergillus saccharolyticus JOP 1030-1]|uniref:Uncharacterized protein n=1 Tax=Aspergillus saccharolyticus JOP 1030-1 TaxID=1450539 RepID=A0A319ABR9_9EURO|nr:hypothetical protein BP01DRAFT_121402 [Aspergillus saccharolyticus JOP 1030-1]PYH49108.1 hypothetical protein BP01DRAFT_121402 [Aspergillus saccharolyticus JOP 1030-1]
MDLHDWLIGGHRRVLHATAGSGLDLPEGGFLMVMMMMMMMVMIMMVMPFTRYVSSRKVIKTQRNSLGDSRQALGWSLNFPFSHSPDFTLNFLAIIPNTPHRKDFEKEIEEFQSHGSFSLAGGLLHSTPAVTNGY